MTAQKANAIPVPQCETKCSMVIPAVEFLNNRHDYSQEELDEAQIKAEQFAIDLAESEFKRIEAIKVSR